MGTALLVQADLFAFKLLLIPKGSSPFSWALSSFCFLEAKGGEQSTEMGVGWLEPRRLAGLISEPGFPHLGNGDNENLFLM